MAGALVRADVPRPPPRSFLCAESPPPPPSARPARRATLEDKRALIDKVDCFIFDCDGVIWRGDTVIPGVPETLAYLRGLGKQLVFVTNNRCVRTRPDPEARWPGSLRWLLLSIRQLLPVVV